MMTSMPPCGSGISLATAWRRRGIGSAMLGELERRLVAAGVRRIQCLLAGDSDLGVLALAHAGYTARRGVVFYERLEPVHPGSAGVLGQLGGRMISGSAWCPPRAIVLFGPPGTGKATFAKGVASRLGWPFVELFPSRLAGESGIAETRRTLTADLVADFEQDIEDYARV
jgi:transitional endoplasmic reticulum ATPase